MNYLREQQKDFCKEYVKNGQNGTQAVLEAYPNVNEPNLAGVMAHENLSKPKIQEEIITHLPPLNKLAKDYEDVKELCLTKEKYSDYIKATDSEVRMQGGFKDTTEHKITHSVEETSEITDMKGRLAKLEGKAFKTIDEVST